MPTFDCPHCGFRNENADRFCEQCGTVFARRPPPPEAADPPPNGPESTAAEGAGLEEGRRSEEPVFGHRWPDPSTAGGEAGEDPEPDAPTPQAEGRPEPLVGDLPGLLEPADPLEFATAGSRISELSDEAQPPPLENVDEEERRSLRELFSAEFPLDASAAPAMHGGGANGQVGRGMQRRFQLEWLLLLVLVAAYLRAAQAPLGGPGPHPLPGLPQAHRRIATLPPNSLVLVNWAYDPATAGEMDRVAQPVIEHLLRRGASLIVVSQLPAGLATARRLIAKAEDAVRQPGRSQIETNVVIEAGFLPGGAASLPLLGAAPAQTLPLDPGWLDLKDRFTVAGLDKTDAVLNLVVAARSEDVRHWLEQVQPFNGGPVVAVTSGASDIPLRPYLQSGQLSGLVSGWDGGSAYRLRSERAAGPEERTVAGRLISGQNWGFAILLVAILLGNLAAIAERRQR